MDSNELVIKALDFVEKTGNKDIDKHTLARLANFSECEMEFVDLFWNTIENKEWIPITKKLATEWFGYKSSRYTLEVLNKKLTECYQLDVDYKEIPALEEEEENNRFSVNLNDPAFQDAYLSFENDLSLEKKRSFAISGECLKNLLLTSSAPKGKAIKNVYSKVETLFESMKKFLSVKEISELKNVINMLNEELTSVKEKSLNYQTSNQKLLSEIKTLELENQELKARLDNSPIKKIVNLFKSCRRGQP